MIKAYLYSFNEEDCAADKWDYGLLKEIFDKYEIEQIKVNSLPNTDRAFVVIPGPQNLGYEEHINKELQKIKRVVLFFTGDEEVRFKLDKINHPNIEIWLQTPHKQHQNYNKLPLGVPQHFKKFLPEYGPKKYNVYFGGQITHSRRKELAKAMQTIPNALFKPTEGFAQGDHPKDYYSNLASTKIAPAPSGAVVIDSFRFYEAIEMLCFPVADSLDPKGNSIKYYDFIYDDITPIKTVDNWFLLKNLIPQILDNYPNNMHKVVCWWIKYKRDLGIKIMRQVNA
jgi:hypothetical protein